jgi:hypothetical protein
MAESKPAFVKPLKQLAASSSRVQEQIKGRLLDVYVETLKGGKEKSMGILVDNDKALKGVLVLEAWAAPDQGYMAKSLKPHVGKVVSFQNSKIQSRGKTMVYFDVAVKMAFDTQTKITVCKEDDQYPHELPVLPDVKHAAAVSSACMISVKAAVQETGQAVERNVGGGVMKPVCNVNVATGNKDMSAALWGALAAQMAAATLGQVYRFDWMMLKPEGEGKFSLQSVTSSKLCLVEGQQADALRDNLADASKMESMSAVYGRGREDKLKEPCSQGSLTTIKDLGGLTTMGGKSAAGVIIVPATHIMDMRGIAVDYPSRAWYQGCTQCKKQLEAVGVGLKCEMHGENKGKKVYGVHLLVADPGHKMELTVWEETLRAMLTELMDPMGSIDSETVLTDLMEAVQCKEMCLRVGVGPKKTGSDIYVDLFDVTHQVNSDGVLALYKNLNNDNCDGSPGLAPACCQNICQNELGQLMLKCSDVVHNIECARLLGIAAGKPTVEVLQDIDGIKVTLEMQCVVCGKQCQLNASGVPTTVQDFMSMPKGTMFTAFTQNVGEDGSFHVAQHRVMDSTEKSMQEKVFKYQAGQFMQKVVQVAQQPDESSASTEQSGNKRTKQMEALMAQSSVGKRLKVQKTSDGDNVF